MQFRIIYYVHVVYYNRTELFQQHKCLGHYAEGIDKVLMPTTFREGTRAEKAWPLYLERVKRIICKQLHYLKLMNSPQCCSLSSACEA